MKVLCRKSGWEFHIKGNVVKLILAYCLKKIPRCLSHPVKFVVMYNTKKICYFTSNKDKMPDLCKSNVVYEITCPGSGTSYIGKTNRRLQTRLIFDASKHTTSRVAQHLIQYEHVRFLISVNNIYDRLNDHPSNARFKRRTFHVPNLMQMNRNKEFCSLTLSSAHEEFDFWTWPTHLFHNLIFVNFKVLYTNKSNSINQLLIT